MSNPTNEFILYDSTNQSYAMRRVLSPELTESIPPGVYEYENATFEVNPAEGSLQELTIDFKIDTLFSDEPSTTNKKIILRTDLSLCIIETDFVVEVYKLFDLVEKLLHDSLKEQFVTEKIRLFNEEQRKLLNKAVEYKDIRVLDKNGELMEITEDIENKVNEFPIDRFKITLPQNISIAYKHKQIRIQEGEINKCIQLIF